MNDWGDDNPRNASGPASALVLLGVAAAAAVACLLASKPGQQVRQQIADRTADWPTRAADALAQGREKIIAAVEEQMNPQSGPVRQKPV